MELGLIQLYMGTGKGKTCAAVGQCLRAAGQGYQCAIVQFMKCEGHSGECAILAQLPNIRLFSFGREQLLYGREGADPADVELAHQAVEKTLSLWAEGIDLLVLDELANAWYYQLLSEEEIKRLLAAKPPTCELVLTGRIAPDFLIEAADLVTECREIKHPYQQGVGMRRGIEY